MGAGGLASEVEGESGSSLLPQIQESGPPVPPQLEMEASWLLDQVPSPLSSRAQLWGSPPTSCFRTVCEGGFLIS